MPLLMEANKQSFLGVGKISPLPIAENMPVHFDRKLKSYMLK